MDGELALRWRHDCLLREIKVLLCVVSRVKSFELVRNAVGGLITIGPVVEDANGASFAYGVKCESSNPNECSRRYWWVQVRD